MPEHDFFQITSLGLSFTYADEDAVLIALRNAGQEDAKPLRKGNDYKTIHVSCAIFDISFYKLIGDALGRKDFEIILPDGTNPREEHAKRFANNLHGVLRDWPTNEVSSIPIHFFLVERTDGRIWEGESLNHLEQCYPQYGVSVEVDAQLENIIYIFDIFSLAVPHLIHLVTGLPKESFVCRQGEEEPKGTLTVINRPPTE